MAHPDINFWQMDWPLFIEFDMMRMSLANDNAFTSTRNSELLFLVSGFKELFYEILAVTLSLVIGAIINNFCNKHKK